MELRDNVCNHPSASAHEAPSAVRSNSELDSVSFKNTPVVFQTGWLEGRTASSPAASKNWRDNASVNETPSAFRSNSERHLVSFKNSPVELQSSRLGARPVSSPAATKSLCDDARNHPRDSANEAPSAVRSKSELVSTKFNCEPVECQTGRLQGRPSSMPANSKMSVSKKQGAALIDAGPKFTTVLVSQDAQGHAVIVPATDKVFKLKHKKTRDTTISKKDHSDFQGGESHGIQRTSSGSQSEPGVVRLKSKHLNVPSASSVGGQATSKFSVSQKEVLKGRCPPHLKSSAAPIDNSLKSRTSSGSAFYSKVVARQVSEAAEQAAQRANSMPTVESHQKAPETLLPPVPHSAVSTLKIVAGLLGLLVLGWQMSIRMLMIQPYNATSTVSEDLHWWDSI